MALTILSYDSLRRQVETASKGMNTVHYTAKGQPSYFYVMAAFNDSVGGALHPAFNLADRTGAGNTAKGELFFGQYAGCLRNGELLSLPGVAPLVSTNHDTFVSYALACNGGSATGFHHANNIEWSAVQQMVLAEGFQPNGNTNYGRSSDNSAERGVAATGVNTGRIAAATGTVTNATLTGSGPNSWRTGNSPFGISDLCGNVWEWAPGVRTNSGEINLISFDGTTAANPANATAADLHPSTGKWYAIDGATGNLVAATLDAPVAGSVRYASANSGTADFTLYRSSNSSFEGMVNSTGPNPVGATALALVKTHGLYPATTGLGGDVWVLNVAGERCPSRGGYWNDSAHAGVFALGCGSARSGTGPALGGRVALVL